MKYYVTAILGGMMDEDACFDTLEEAKETRDKWNAEEKANGHEDGFWMVVDENGEETK